MGEVIAIISGSGGVGKTFLTANIGAALASRGLRVCLIDLNWGLRSLDLAMGLENRIIYTLYDVMKDECEISNALVRDKRFDERLYLLPAPQTVGQSYLELGGGHKVINDLREAFDYIIIDTPTGISKGFELSIKVSDRTILVAIQTVASCKSTDRMQGLIKKVLLKSPMLLINKIRPDLIGQGYLLDIDDILSHLQIELLGLLVDDSFKYGEPIVLCEKSRNAEQVLNIAKRILGQTTSTVEEDLQKLRKTIWNGTVFKRIAHAFGV